MSRNVSNSSPRRKRQSAEMDEHDKEAEREIKPMPLSVLLFFVVPLVLLILYGIFAPH